MDNDGNKITWSVIIIAAVASIGLMVVAFMPSQTANIKAAIGNELSSFVNSNSSINNSSSSNSSSSSHTAVGTNLLKGTSSDLQTAPDSSFKFGGGELHYFSSDELSSLAGNQITARAFIHNTTTHTVNLVIWTNGGDFGIGTGVPAGTDGYSTIMDYNITSNSTRGDINIRAYTENAAISGVQYKKLKIEKGSVATPWCPNPSDHIVSD